MVTKQNGKPVQQTPNVIGDFDQIVAQLRDMLGSLQDRVSTLTNDLQVAAEVSTQVATILELEDLLPELVETVKERFDLYHAHVYLLDDAGDKLVLRAGAGQPGKAMMERGHSIPLNAPLSIVALAARSNEAVIANDVTEAEDWLPNPLLPDTRSEMAIPMVIGSDVIGVLDVQSEVEGRFTDIDRQVKTTLARQLAVAVRNSETFTEIDETRRQLALVANVSSQISTILDPEVLLPEVARLTTEAFDLYHIHIWLTDEHGDKLSVYAGDGRAPCQHVDHHYTINVKDEQSLVTEAAITRESYITNDAQNDEVFEPSAFLPDTRSQLTIPLIFADKVVGVLDVHDDVLNAFTDDDVLIYQSLATQVAIAIENARSYQASEKRATDLETVAAVSGQISTILELENLLPELVEVVKSGFELYHAHVYLLDATGKNLVLQAGAGEPGRQMLEAGHSIPADAEKSLVARAAREREGVLVSDVTRTPDWLPNPLLPDTQSELAVPLVLGGEVLGVLDVQSAEQGRFTDIDLQVKTTLADQLAIAIQNARTIQQRQQAEDRETLAYEIGQQLSEQQNTQDLLQFAVNRLAQAFNYYHVHVYTFNDNTETLSVAAGLGEAGRLMVEEGHSIPIEREQSLVATAARDREPVLVLDVTESEDHMPNPLIPDTLSEVALPLYVGDALMGVLDVQSERVAAFDNSELRLLSIVSNQLAVSLQNARSLEQTRLRLRDVQLANRAADIIAAANDIPTMLNDILELAAEAIGADNAAYTALTDDGTAWQGLAGYGMTQDFVESIQNDYADFPHGVDAIENNHTVTIDNAHAYAGFPEEYIESIGIKSVAAMPVMGRRAPLGVAFFNFNDRFHTFTQEEIDLLEGLARQIGTGIESKRFAQLNERLSRLVNTSEDVISYGDPDTGEILYMNNGGATLLGYDTPHEIVGKHIPDLHPPDSADRIINEGLPALQKGESWRGETEAFTKDGEIIPVEQNIFAITDDEGNIVSVATIMTDITERKIAEAERQRIYEVSQDMIGIAGFDGYFKDVNPSWSKVLGWSDEELKQNPFISFVHPDDVEHTQAEAAKVAEGVEVLNFTNRYRTKDGSYRWLSWNSTTDYEEENIYFVARDITEERERAAIVERRAKDLETISDIATDVANTPELDALLKNAANLTKERFDLYHAHIYLLDEEGETLVLAAGAGDAGDLMKQRGHRIKLNHPHSIVADAARENNPVIANDVTEAEDFLPNPILPETRAEMAIPLVVNREVIGVLDVQSESVGRFDNQDVTIKSILAGQLAVAVSNARRFESTQQARAENERRARELETVAQVSAATSTILDVDNLLLNVAELTKTAFDLYHAHIYLYDDEAKVLELAAGAGEAGQVMKDHGHSIALDHPTSIVANAARQLGGVVINDVMASETFMPNPLLPETRAEMAIPMVSGGVLIGVLDVQSELVGRFDDEDIRVKSTLAAQVAIAVDNARAFQMSAEVAERERAAAERLREVDRLKTEFLASMSHELRTPLNSIIGYSEVMLDGGDGDLPEEAMEDIDIIYTSGKHLLNIINDILDLAKIEASQMKLNRKPADMVELLEGVIKANRVLIGDRPVDISMESEVDELIIPMDELRIRQVVLNLFSNAVKFTDEGSVTISLTMQDDETARVAVSDTGIGISQEGIDILFDRFRQVDGSSTRKAGGTGLGLAITRHLINMHGGKINVKSEVGVGSTFWFTLPLVEPEEAPQELLEMPVAAE